MLGFSALSSRAIVALPNTEAPAPPIIARNAIISCLLESSADFVVELELSATLDVVIEPNLTIDVELKGGL